MSQQPAIGSSHNRGLFKTGVTMRTMAQNSFVPEEREPKERGPRVKKMHWKPHLVHPGQSNR